LSGHLRALSHAIRDDGGQSVVLPLEISILRCAFNEEERIEKAIRTGRNPAGLMTIPGVGAESRTLNPMASAEASASVAG
jgi:hypothetical protein